ncbi:hypothetical protein [Mesorhizobium sp. M2A.F.Ca.ET.043.02.1.1]|uniref:hypothetical protein n=1 Tax=Mesorhizobium sp. M2A.F.Ca.ET.043.02.1.1 TaxID=2493670 RepID=UPI000F75952C|nr:hypothetical protein [Mesorhizobium sp. M2A.F.Ca.ET.043.02.1.1]AZO05611.1 hypothetical protein EJ068_22975 [Mesorhizobium sp. M2A.F.Ca.ET.043.02.1.1]
MNKEHLTTLWRWLSVACVLFLATTIISLQGGSEFLGRLFGDRGSSAQDNNPAVGYFGAIVSSGLFLLASIAFLLHARRHGDHWHSRIPVVWLQGLDTSALEAKIFQICVLLVFVAMPLAGIVRCMDEAESGDICEQNTENFYTGSETTLLWAPGAKEHNQMRLRKADAGDMPCSAGSAGIELFPRSWTPLGFYGLPLAAGSVATLAILSVILRRRPEIPVTPNETT